LTHTIDFYFDFMSPYAYLGSVGVERLAAEHRCVVDWHPILLGVSVIKVMGLKALPDTPVKRDYVRHDVERFARYLDIPFRRSETAMAPLPAARIFVWLKRRDPEVARDFAQAVFREQWAQARNMSTPQALAGLAPHLGLSPAEMIAATTDPAIKRYLHEDVERAIAAGVFGAPTFVVGREMFWGVDRLPMVERWIVNGGW
jgi:2-hydroxychromene-2-carboxylate isomerase